MPAVLTLNAYLWPWLLRLSCLSSNKTRRYNSMVSLFQKYDIVFLQEWYCSWWCNQWIERIKTDWDGYVSHTNINTKWLDSGLVVLTKSKTSWVKFVQFQETRDIFKYINRGFLMVSVYDVIWINVHLHPPECRGSDAIRLQQIMQIKKEITKIGNQKIAVVGDFNSTNTETFLYANILGLEPHIPEHETCPGYCCDLAMTNFDIRNLKTLKGSHVSDHEPVEFNI